MSDDEGINDISYQVSNAELYNGGMQESSGVDSCNNNIISSTQKTSGVGDTPDLISDETPPSAILEIASDSDLFLFETSTSNAKGEGTEMVVNPPKGSPENISTTVEPISAENDTPVPSQINDEDAAVPPLTIKIKCTSESYTVSPVSSSTALLVQSPTTLNDNKSPISSSHQTKVTTSYDNQNGDKFLLVQTELRNDAQANSLMLSSTNMDTRPAESIDSPYIQETEEERTAKHVIKEEKEVPSTVNEKKGNSSNINSPMESGAVSAPEVEHQVDVDGKNVVGDSICMNKTTTQPDENVSSHTSAELCGTGSEVVSTFPTDNITKTLNIDENESYDAGELLLEQQQEHEKSESPISENEDCSDCDSEAPADAADAEHTSSSPPPSLEEKDLSSAIITKRKVGKGSKRLNHKSKRKPSNSVTRNSSKSPIRIVEVYERSTPLEIKKPKAGKPMSPYQCKVFPVPVQRPDPGASSAFTVSSKQRQILDKELSRGLEKEKNSLVEALTEYYSNNASCTNSSSCLGTGRVEDDSIISSGSQRETYMSWLINEKHRERMEEAENYGGISWNPMANIFRRSTFTQVSNRPSFTDKAHAESSTSTDTGNSVNAATKPTNLGIKFRLVGEQEETDILDAGRNMYQSLKSLQKAIHLSDLFCFRNTTPELPLGESLSLPGFQQFMESENEIQVLANIMALLGSAKDDVEMYLTSLQKANLVTGDDSGLTKVEISNKNELGDDKDEQENWRKDDLLEEPDCILESQQELVPFTCPSCQSQMDLEISNPRRDAQINNRNRLLPKIYSFLGEQSKITLSTYYTAESKSLVQTALCNGNLYQLHFSALDPSGPLQGITKAKNEYLGQPSHFTLEILLSTIHRCASYIDTRIACACVWTRQSKRYFLELIELYLEKQYKPTTDMSRWKLYSLGRKLKTVNVFAGVIRNLSEELVEAVNKIHFCMQKSRVLLNKNLKEPEMPGFSLDSTTASWEDIKPHFSSIGLYSPPKGSFHEYCETNMTSSVELLYEKLKTATTQENEKNNAESEDNNVSVQILMQIVAQASKDIERISDLGEHYKSIIQMPGKSGKQVLQFLNTTLSQMGFSKHIQFGTLVATFLAVVDKLSLFEEFMCEQKVEIRAKVHRMCLKIIRKLYDLRANLCMEMNWSINLAKNSFMRLKELNEIKRIRKRKKLDKHMNEEIEFVRGSDGSLRASVC